MVVWISLLILLCTYEVVFLKELQLKDKIIALLKGEIVKG